MNSKSNELAVVLESVQTTMRQCKGSLKNAAMLRNLCTLKPILYNKTRWSGKHDTLLRFIEIRMSLIDAANDENTNIDINATNGFLNKVKKHQKHLERIQLPTKEMQTQYHTLSDCRADLDLLIQDITECRTIQGHDLYQCDLKKVYIGVDSEKLDDGTFESGVVKIQNNSVRDMTVFEKNACFNLKISDANVVGNVEGNDTNITYKERRNRCKNKSHCNEVDYGELDFILGSAAVVERLWSIADGLIDGHRNNTSPVLMEALLHLRANRQYWDTHLVQEAFNATRSQRVRQKLDEDLEVVSEEGEA